MADGRYFENSQTRHVLPTVQLIAMIFGTLMQTAPLNCTGS